MKPKIQYKTDGLPIGSWMSDENPNRPMVEKISPGILHTRFKIEKCGTNFRIKWLFEKKTWRFLAKLETEDQWIELDRYYVNDGKNCGRLTFKTEADAAAYAAQVWGQSGWRLQEWQIV